MHGFGTSARIMELAGMELVCAHLEFHIAIVLAMVAEWEDVGVFIVQTVWPIPPREVYRRPALPKKFGTLLVKHPNPNSAPQICISLSWKPFLNLNFNKKDKNQKLTAKVNQACLQEFKNHPRVLCIFCPSLFPYLLLRVTHC